MKACRSWGGFLQQQTAMLFVRLHQPDSENIGFNSPASLAGVATLSGCRGKPADAVCLARLWFLIPFPLL